MVVHTPFFDKSWVWIKALTGVLMFQAVLVLVVGEANNLADLAREVAERGRQRKVLMRSIKKSSGRSAPLLAISVVDIVLGVWRPRIMKMALAPLKGAVDYVFERKS